jgi:hypothetical protein
MYNPLAFHFLEVRIFSKSIYEKPFFGDLLINFINKIGKIKKIPYFHLVSTPYSLLGITKKNGDISNNYL